MTPKLLSAGALAEVARAVSLGGPGMEALGHLLAHIAALDQMETQRILHAGMELAPPLPHAAAAEKIAALEADNAALLAVLRASKAALDEFDPSDALKMLRDVIDEESPGAHLLAEHAKALVRARNVGLEKCAAVFDLRRRHGERALTASDMRAMKEPES